PTAASPTSGRLPAASPATGAHPAASEPRGRGRRALANTVVERGPPLPTPSDFGRVDERFRRFPTVGERFDGYTIFKALGKGNMGKIYQARDSMNRKVAMKVILADVANSEGLARFQREGQALAAIPRHKNIVQVHSSGTIRGLPYLTMDYVEGQSLAEVLREQGPLPLKSAGLVVEKLAKALQVAHAAGVLHRDLKPANVLIRNDDGEPVLTDFGLAGLRGAESLTQTGDILGTPLYMAPEQVLGLNKEVDGRTDVWGLGVLLYELLTGAVPFPGTSMVEVCNAITNQDPLPVSALRPEVDPTLAGVVAKALAKDKRDRFQTPDELRRALKEWRRAREKGVELPPPPPPLEIPWWKRPRAQLAIGAVCASLFAIGSAVAARSASKQPPKKNTHPTQRTARDEALPQAERVRREVLVAFESGKYGAAAEALRQHAELLRGRSWLVSLRNRVNDLVERRLRVRPVVADDLRGPLRLGGALNELGSEPPSQAFADAVVESAFAFEEEASERLGDPNTLDLLEELAKNGFRPDPVRLRDRYTHHLVLVRKPEGPDFSRRLLRLLACMVRLQVDLDLSFYRNAAARIDPRALGSATDAHEQYLAAMLELGRAHDSRQSARVKEALAALKPLLEGPAAATLGRRNVASAWLAVVSSYREEESNESTRKILLERALATDPEHTGVLAALASLHWERAKRALNREGNGEAAKAEARAALDYLKRGLAACRAQGLDRSAAYLDRGRVLRRRAARCAAFLGLDTLLDELFASLQELPEVARRHAGAELEEYRAEGRRLRELLREGTR
ncbi:MAG: serine/threonine protein kinase, partial [Planctomycetota bacterium]